MTIGLWWIIAIALCRDGHFKAFGKQKRLGSSWAFQDEVARDCRLIFLPVLLPHKNPAQVATAAVERLVHHESPIIAKWDGHGESRQIRQTPAQFQQPVSCENAGG